MSVIVLGQTKSELRRKARRDKTKMTVITLMTGNKVDRDEALEIVQGGLMCSNIPQKAGQTKSKLRRKARRDKTKTTVITLMTGNKVDRQDICDDCSTSQTSRLV